MRSGLPMDCRRRDAIRFHAVKPLGFEIVELIVDAGVGAVALHSKPRCTELILYILSS